MSSLLLAALLMNAPLPEPPEKGKDDPPAKKELFAKEGWYKEQAGKEQDFVGVLEKVKGGGGIGFGRFNPYRLTMTVIVNVEVSVMTDGKVEKRIVPETRTVVREVYVGGKPELLEAYAGKKVKLVGKAVDMEVEGRKHNEIWPARLEVVAEEKKPGKDEKPKPSESPARPAPEDK